jgi:uncharacterized protein (DUF433 family)
VFDLIPRPEMTPQPWPEATHPTVEQLLPWFLEQTEEAQLWILRFWDDESAVADSCRVNGHERHIERLATALRTRPTYGAAVWVDPGRRFGSPCVGGTGLGVEFVVGLVWVEDVATVMAEYNLTRSQVLGACWFVAAYGVDSVADQMNGKFKRWGSQWPKRWAGWASEYGRRLAEGDDTVPDPPRKGDD